MNETVSVDAAAGDIRVNRDTVWLTQRQMANLYVRDRSVTKEVDQHTFGVVGNRGFLEGATAEDPSVVQTEGQRLCQWLTHRLRRWRLDKSDFGEGRFLTLPSTGAAQFAESTPSVADTMARLIVKPLAEPNA